VISTGYRAGRMIDHHFSDSRSCTGEAMTHTAQPDPLKGSPVELFGDEQPAKCGAGADETREWLQGLLAEARAAETMPWPPLYADLYRALFPQMTLRLPEDEGAQLCLEFETELARLDSARADR
jgi:hypothetical protein